MLIIPHPVLCVRLRCFKFYYYTTWVLFHISTVWKHVDVEKDTRYKLKADVLRQHSQTYFTVTVSFTESGLFQITNDFKLMNNNCIIELFLKI